MAIYRVRATLTYVGGSPGLSTTYHRAASGAATLAAAQAASDRVRGAWDVVKTILATTTVVSMQAGVDLLDEEDGTLLSSFATTPLGTVTGTSATGTGPPQVMAGLVLNTSSVIDGRRLRGRMNIGPLATGFSGAATPQSATITAVNAMGVALVTVSPPAATAPLVVWHRPKFSPPGTIVRIGSAVDVLSSGIAPKWYTLRSRLN